MSSLGGRHILVVEDEFVIAHDISGAFSDVGAQISILSNATNALNLIAYLRIDAAIIDHLLRDGTALFLCSKLRSRHIPFVIYSGVPDLPKQFPGGLAFEKPQSPRVLVNAIERLIRMNRLLRLLDY